MELLGAQVVSTEFQRSLIWKSGRFPQAPAQDVNILAQPMHCQLLGKLRCLSSWGICLESITLPTLRGLVPGEVHSDSQHAPFCLLTPASNSSLVLSTLGMLPPVPVKPLLVPSKFHLSLPTYPPGNPVDQEGVNKYHCPSRWVTRWTLWALGQFQAQRVFRSIQSNLIDKNKLKPCIPTISQSKKKKKIKIIK